MTLGPGGQSALRHWHTLEDEFVYVLSGEVVLVTDAGEQTLTRRDVRGLSRRKARRAPLRQSQQCAGDFLEVGNRTDGDNAFYPDDDLMWCEDENGVYAAHKDGRRY